MNKLSICLLTYNRLQYASKTLRSTLENIIFDGQLHVHIADDGSTEEYRKSLKFLAGGYSHVHSVTVSNSERGGYGKNYNLAMQVCHNASDYVLPLEDDWVLKRKLDLNILIDALNTSLRIGCIRLGYIGYTQPLRGEFVSRGGNHYILLDSNSPEPHVFAGHPRLETITWAKSVGPWPEGLNAGETEFSIAHRPSARIGVAWPVDMIKPSGDMFVHIGSVKA
jgi:glycosyltransferase involved in cell wall biosynthesis